MEDFEIIHAGKMSELLVKVVKWAQMCIVLEHQSGNFVYQDLE